MILSVSRRTDVPNYYSEWFYNRIKEGYLYVRNPVNAHQISKIDLSPELVDCIVFWTKNPEPMLGRLEELSAYHYYFQFTLTGYGKDIEWHVPHKKKEMIPIFHRLSGQIGADRVIWRYDPILFTKIYTPEYHLEAFEQIASALEGDTEKCVISFLDIYAKNRKNIEAMGAYEIEREELAAFAARLAEIAKAHHITVATCAETVDLSMYGIEHNCCIDRMLVEKILGCKIRAGKDKNQRPECGCIESVEVGTYNTCRNGCQYCYANYSLESVIRNGSCYDPHSPLLCGTVTAEDKITERKVRSLKETQLSLFD